MLKHESAATMRTMKILKCFSLLFGALLVQSAHTETGLDLIELPDSFKIDIFAVSVEPPREMVRNEL